MTKTETLLNQAKLNEDESSISCAEKTFFDEDEAMRVFSAFKTKLLRVDEWNENSSLSSYQLFDEAGQVRQDEKLSVGTFMRVSLKGSGKYDWIKVVDIDEKPDEFIITVKPTYDPSAENIDESVISHFFTDASTNNFCLSRKAEKVALYVIGLGEKQNTSETGSAFQTIRNVVVNLASYLGIQRGEWEKFCHNFLEDVANNEEDGIV